MPMTPELRELWMQGLAEFNALARVYRETMDDIEASALDPASIARVLEVMLQAVEAERRTVTAMKDFYERVARVAANEP